MKKIIAVMVATMMALSFSLVAMAAEGTAPEQPAAGTAEKVDKKDAKKDKKDAKKEKKDVKKEEAKPAKKAKKEVSGC